MATPSSLISEILSLLHLHPFLNHSFYPALRLRMVLRNLMVLLLCLRYLDDDDKPATQSLFSRIETAIRKASTADYINGAIAMFDNLRAVDCLAKQVIDECEWRISNHLTLDDAVEVADSLLHNTADFWVVAEFCWNAIPDSANLRDAMKDFEVRLRFLRDFLLFANQTCADIHQIQNLLIHIHPFLLDLARSFQIDEPFCLDHTNWVKGVQSKCPRVDSRFFQAFTQTLRSMPTLDIEADDDVLKHFLTSLISLLWHLLCHRRHSDSLQALYEGLRNSRSILKRGRHSSNTDFGVLVRDAGILICSLYHADVDPPPSMSDLLQRFDVVKAQLPSKSNSLESNALAFGDSTRMEDVCDGELQIETALTSPQSSSTPRHVGFQEDEVKSILDRLFGGSKQLRLVPISGMAGLGKTTFALKIYNHPSVKYGFQARAWCTISQVFDMKSVLLKLLNQIQPRDYLEMTEDDLANKLRQSLKQKRYLIVLDDVWTPQVLESLRLSFPDDTTQSRIVLTSRLHSVVPCALHDEHPHFLRLRKESECLEIIEMKLLHKAVGLSTELGKFVKLCKGLPLTAVLVAGLLATTAQQGWEGILDRLSSGGISGVEQCNAALELSYIQLPDDLKLCFLYFGAFPENEEIYARKLIRLWMAEGFVTRERGLSKKRAEDVAQEYLDNLIHRNLVMVTKKGSICGVKTCRIHDLLHDFCLMKSKQKNIFHRLLQKHDGLSDFNEPCNLVRLSIHSDAHHFKESGLFCPLAHSLLLFTPMGDIEGMLFIIQIYKHLRVLDMDQTWFSAEVPSEIVLLTRLTYLSITCLVPVIPSSIGNLSNLETLIVKHFDSEPISLPHTIWDLQKLKYLSITCMHSEMHFCGFSLPIENLESSPNLLELESICGVILYFDGSMEKQMRKFPNIRRLKGHILYGGKSSKELIKIVVVPKFLSKLELLTLSAESQLRYLFDFGCAEKLRKVKLHGFVLSREEIAVLGKLANLEVLKLFGISFLGGRMEMEEGEFSKLRILVLREYYEHLETWTAAGDEPLPCLEKLVFLYCADLQKIPYSCLETSSTLEEIEVYRCSSTLESLVRGIERFQKDFDNLIKVQIYPEPGSKSEEAEEEEEEEEEEEQFQQNEHGWGGFLLGCLCFS